MDLLIRSATEEDLGALLRLYRQLHVNDELPPADLAQCSWDSIRRDTSRSVLLAELGQRPIGTLEHTVSPDLTRGGRPFMTVENVVVDERYRRRGIGKRLVERP